MAYLAVIDHCLIVVVRVAEGQTILAKVHRLGIRVGDPPAVFVRGGQRNHGSLFQRGPRLINQPERHAVPVGQSRVAVQQHGADLCLQALGLLVTDCAGHLFHRRFIGSASSLFREGVFRKCRREVRRCKGAFGDQLFLERDLLSLDICKQGGAGDIYHVGPQKALPVHPLGQDAAFLCQCPRRVPGEVSAVSLGIAKGPQHKGQVHLRRRRVRRAEPILRYALGEPRSIGIGYIAVRPVGHVGEGMGLCALLRRRFFSQRTHQHGERLRPVGGTLQGKVGGPVFLFSHAEEQSQLLKLRGQPVLNVQIPGRRCDPQGSGPYAHRQA